MTSYYHIACYAGEKSVGYIDSVSNGVTDTYGKSIGTELMNRMKNELKV